MLELSEHHRRIPVRALSLLLILCSPTLAARPAASPATRPAPLVHLDQIHMRDPFVLPVREEGRYYLFGTIFTLPGGQGFVVYSSADLESWDGPRPAFVRPSGWWGEYDFWAPEVHPYRGCFYMFASFKGTGHERGTAVLVADKPEGPYRPHSEYAITPAGQSCLDGTLFIDPDQKPWMVYCHEWAQIGDGAICAIRMSEDLKAAAGEPIVLFHASDAPWVKNWQEQKPSYVTDGPFFYRMKDGALLMLWSSFGGRGERNLYCLGVARSQTGALQGPWTQQPSPLYEEDGGHGMLFRDFQGRLLLSLHQPNSRRTEHPRLLRVEEVDGELHIGGEVGAR
jgi:arabinan endo-1,5-alpha-L-arabinosidase